MECYVKGPGSLIHKDIGAVVECISRNKTYSSLNDIYDVVNEVAEWIKDNLEVDIRHIVFSENEPIGDKFILYKYHLELDKGNYISCRVITYGDNVLATICTMDLELVKKFNVRVGEDKEPSIKHTRLKDPIRELPPGQKIIPYFIIYRILGQPRIDLSTWRLKVKGLVAKELEITYEDLLYMPCKEIVYDFHCVTGWSVKNVRWTGVPLKHLALMTGVSPKARWVFVEGLDGYTTIIPLEDFIHEDSLLALKLNGRPLSLEQGFPARIIIPHLYGWKGVKWVKTIEFTDKYIEGYWEKLGYHPRGNVWLEERFKHIN